MCSNQIAHTQIYTTNACIRNTRPYPAKISRKLTKPNWNEEKNGGREEKGGGSSNCHSNANAANVSQSRFQFAYELKSFCRAPECLTEYKLIVVSVSVDMYVRITRANNISHINSHFNQFACNLRGWNNIELVYGQRRTWKLKCFISRILWGTCY